MERLFRYEPQRLFIGSLRHYMTPDGDALPGITTVLGETKTEQTRAGLNAWQKRIGEDAAKMTLEEACARGTWVHSQIESILLGDEPDTNEVYQPWLESMLPILEDVSNVQLQEGAVWNVKLKYAGTLDCIGDYKGVPSLIDWKTSARYKRRDWVQDYFIQATAYLMAANILYPGLNLEQAVIAIALPGGKAQVFTLGKEEITQHKFGLTVRLLTFRKQQEFIKQTMENLVRV
jgi:hypothetical protein